LLVVNEILDFPEAAIHKALSKLSWKLLKKEMDKFPWYKNPIKLLELIMRSDSLLNKRANAEKAKKRSELFVELLNHVDLKTSDEIVDHFKKRLGFFAVADECFNEVLKFEGEFSALKDLEPDSRVWSTMNWFVEDSNYLHKKIEEKFKGDKPVLINSLSVTGESGVPVDPSVYHTQQVEALGSAILMEAYRYNWFNSEGIVVIPDRVQVGDDETFKAGSILYNANIWALLDNLQEQVRFLGREFLVRAKSEYENAPKEFKFGIEFGNNTSAEIFDYIAGQRNSTRESSNFFDFKKDVKLNSLLDAVSSITGSQTVKDHHIAASSLSVLLNYDVLEDDALYEGLNLTQWIDGFCGLREFCSGLRSPSTGKHPLTSELLTFTKESLLEHLQSVGMTQENSAAFIDRATFHRKARDLFDAPLIKTSNGYVVVSDILLGSVISRAIASNILSRKWEFKPKGDGLESTVKEIFTSNGIEAVSYKRRFPDPEGEFEYDTLILWDGKLFVMECKNRWLCEGRSVAIYNFLKQSRADVNQVSRLVAGLKAHPEMVNAAFGRIVSYDEVVPCVIGGLPHAMPDQISGIYFTDISIISRFFSDRYFGVEYADGPRKEQNVFYDQWQSDKPSASDFIRAISRPVQVALVMGSINIKTVEFAVGSSIHLKSKSISSKYLDLDAYKELVSRL